MEGNNIKIKFSPFEALLIGEKNRVVKRQPQKNTVFVTRLNKVRKTVNLRELFDLKSDPSSKRSRTTEKFENVCDFLKHSTKVKKVRKTEIYNNIKKKRKQKDVYCYEFGGRKLIVEGDEFVEFKLRDGNDEQEIVEKIHKHEKREKSEKKTPVKFKPDFKFKETLEEKIVNKFHNRRLRSKSAPENLVLSDIQKIRKTKQSSRGPDGKFVKSNGRPNNVTPRQKFLSKYLHEIYLKKNKDMFNKEPKVIVDSDDSDTEEPYSSEDDSDDVILLSESNKKFDLNQSETKLDQISVRYHQKYSTGALNFPPYPKRIKPSDFDDDDHLINILYEDTPRSLKSEAKENFVKFRKALERAEMGSPAKKMKVYEKKKPNEKDDIEVVYDSRMEKREKGNQGNCKRRNGFVVKTEGEKNGFCVKIEGRKNGYNAQIDKKKNGLMIKNEKKNECDYRIDQPPPKDNHLIEGTNLGNLFFDRVDGNDIFLGNFVKPVLNDSPFGTIPSV